MTQQNRLATGGRIDRSRPLRFTFDGRELTGFRGDTIASALLANDVHRVARSFKYHRSRGIVGAGIEEPNALVTLDGGLGRVDPNRLATVETLSDGMRVRSQNRWPNLAVDVGSVAGVFSALLPAGFYYKTFMWPRRGWSRFYEPAIRRSAGLGPAPRDPDPDRYAQRFAHCDVLVVGAGPAGLAAALAAAERGSRVVLCDEQAEFGGTLLAESDVLLDGTSGWEWVSSVRRMLASHPNVRMLERTTAFAFGADNFVSLVERLEADASADAVRERVWFVRAQRVVLATGAIERPMVFPDNDRPGVMLASAAATYVGRYAVVPGRRVMLVTAHDYGYEIALRLRRQGVPTLTIIDVRAQAPAALLEAAAALDIEVLIATVPAGTRGGARVRGLAAASVRGDGHLDTRRWLDCDLVLMAGGFTPSVQLHSQARGRLVWNGAAQSFVPEQSSDAIISVGAARGVFELAECVLDGRAAGASDGAPGVWKPRPVPISASPTGGTLNDNVHSNSSPARAFVDFQNDVTARDVELAVREGFTSIEHVKRYTTLGMATDQGRTSNLNGLAVAARALGVPVSEIGLTTFRAPFTPVTFGALAGVARQELLDPIRVTPIHSWAAENGAVFEDVGLWKRARYFPRPGEDMTAAVARECRETRRAVGLFDASTLGKIEVVGRDAAEFMNRMYTNAWTKLECGRCRYAVMLRDDGFVFDDGVVGRIAADRFHVTTTTGGAPRVLAHMEDYLQTEFTDLEVWLTSTTEQWAVIALNGPRARDVLATLVDGIDISAHAFPHMAVREGRICGVPTRLFRVSFTGELGFEINVATDKARAVWEAIRHAGEPFGITPYGTEAMHVLRAEKGYIIVGQETDGTVTPFDLGLDWAVGKTKRDFVGMRALQLPALRGPGRLQLVGLRSSDCSTVLAEGAQVVSDAYSSVTPSLGHVTSAYYSAELGEPIALALVVDGVSRIGEHLWVTAKSGTVAVQIVKPVFVDPSGARLNV